MVKTILDWLLTINLIILLGLSLYLWWSGRLQVTLQPAPETPAANITNPRTEQLFITTLRDTVDRQLGAPEAGYTPDMFLETFPGMVATDFEDVEASIGKYVVVEGQLVHVTPPGTPVHGAASAVSSRGLTTLLQNIALRTQVDLADDGTITDIMRAISGE